MKKAAPRRVNKSFLMDILDILSSLDDHKSIQCKRRVKLHSNTPVGHLTVSVLATGVRMSLEKKA